MQLLLFRRCRPNDHIRNSVAGFDGMELVYHDPHGAIVGSRQRKKQQRLWREKDQGMNMCVLHQTGIPPSPLHLQEKKVMRPTLSPSSI